MGRGKTDKADDFIPDTGERHRVILSPAAEIEGRQADQILQSLIDRVEAPR